jgi:hypothetical protein
MIRDYPKLVQTYFHLAGDRLSVTQSNKPLEADDIEDEIDKDRPIIAAIFNLAHAVLIVGYDEREYKDDDSNTDRLILIVNDPYPHDAVGMKNPYTSAAGTELQGGQVVNTR